MAMLEDNMRLGRGFDAFVAEQIRRQFRSGVRGRRRHQPDLLVLGAWGEGYVSSLASARRIVRSLQQQGIPQNIDVMLNEGHAGPVVRLPPKSVPWAHRVGPNLGDCLKTAHIRIGELPAHLLSAPRRVLGQLRQIRPRPVRQHVCKKNPGRPHLAYSSARRKRRRRTAQTCLSRPHRRSASRCRRR